MINLKLFSLVWSYLIKIILNIIWWRQIHQRKWLYRPGVGSKERASLMNVRPTLIIMGLGNNLSADPILVWCMYVEMEIRTKFLVFADLDSNFFNFGKILFILIKFRKFLFWFFFFRFVLDRNWNIHEIPISNPVLVFENSYFVFPKITLIIPILLYILDDWKIGIFRILLVNSDSKFSDFETTFFSFQFSKFRFV